MVAGGNDVSGLVELDPEPQPKLVRTTVSNPNAAIPRIANFTDQHLFAVLIPSGIDIGKLHRRGTLVNEMPDSEQGSDAANMCVCCLKSAI
jgi:hypothetical protein